MVKCLERFGGAMLQAVDRLMKESWDRWMKDSDNVAASVRLCCAYPKRVWEGWGNEMMHDGT